MQTVTEFMRCFFQAKVARHSCEACEQRHEQYLEKYFTKDLAVNMSANSIELKSQREANPAYVVSIEDHRTSALVITSEPLAGNSHYRYRYHLKFSDAGWLIDRVDKECALCKGTGQTCGGVCKMCGGEIWRQQS